MFCITIIYQNTLTSGSDSITLDRTLQILQELSIKNLEPIRLVKITSIHQELHLNKTWEFNSFEEAFRRFPKLILLG